MKGKNIEIYYSILLFGATYCLLALPSIFMENRFFKEYGFFKNENIIEQVAFLVILYSIVLFVAYLSNTKKFFKMPRWAFFFSDELLFVFYFCIYIFCLYDYLLRNQYQLYVTTDFFNALSKIGYLVANSTSKFSFGYIYISSFIFCVFLIRHNIAFLIKLFSFFAINFNVAVLLLSGRKEQAITAICVLLFYFKIRFKLNLKVVFVFFAPIFFAIVIFLNFVRGDVSKKPFVDIVLYSQESYPVILGTYLPFMGELLDKSRSDVTGFFATTFPFTSCLENAVDFINKNIFHEFGYGVVISIFGYIYFYFPLSLMVIYLVFYITNIIINTIRKIDEAFVVFSLYFFVKIFFLLRNGIVANYILDVLVLMFFCFPLFLFSKKSLNFNG